MTNVYTDCYCICDIIRPRLLTTATGDNFGAQLLATASSDNYGPQLLAAATSDNFGPAIGPQPPATDPGL